MMNLTLLLRRDGFEVVEDHRAGCDRFDLPRAGLELEEDRAERNCRRVPALAVVCYPTTGHIRIITRRLKHDAARRLLVTYAPETVRDRVVRRGEQVSLNAC